MAGYDILEIPEPRRDWAGWLRTFTVGEKREAELEDRQVIMNAISQRIHHAPVRIKGDDLVYCRGWFVRPSTPEDKTQMPLIMWPDREKLAEEWEVENLREAIALAKKYPVKRPFKGLKSFGITPPKFRTTRQGDKLIVERLN